MALRAVEWRRLPVPLTELCIDTTLCCGQSFRWRQSAPGEWSCALHGRIVSLRQDPTHLHYRAFFPAALPNPPSSAAGEDDTLALVRHYLNLAPNLTQLYELWAAADDNFKKRAPKFTGIRILRQDPWEALIAFICSSNNNIARISSMVHKLCTHYGPLIGHLDNEPYHDFPTPVALAGPGVEAHLVKLGFGYRARYIANTAKMIAQDKGLTWLEALCNPESPVPGERPKSAGGLVEGGRQGYQKAHQELLTLQGVGPKVADCVCLMGLGWSESVPVDTHVWQIAQRDYRFAKGRHNSLTAVTYAAVANRFRNLWGKEAGWAHSVLFAADLKTFSERVVAKTKVKKEEIIVKEEAEIPQLIEKVERTITTKRKRVKKEADELETQVIENKATVKRSKRNRAR